MSGATSLLDAGSAICPWGLSPIDQEFFPASARLNLPRKTAHYTVSELFSGSSFQATLYVAWLLLLA